jgi:hypothetical protein
LAANQDPLFADDWAKTAPLLAAICVFAMSKPTNQLLKTGGLILRAIQEHSPTEAAVDGLVLSVIEMAQGETRLRLLTGLAFKVSFVPVS